MRLTKRSNVSSFSRIHEHSLLLKSNKSSSGHKKALINLSPVLGKKSAMIAPPHILNAEQLCCNQLVRNVIVLYEDVNSILLLINNEGEVDVAIKETYLCGHGLCKLCVPVHGNITPLHFEITLRRKNDTKAYCGSTLTNLINLL